MEKVIFPYIIELDENSDKKNAKLRIIDEVSFSKSYPYAYKYLTMFKSVLSLRDKGEKQYELWYAFGRNQALLYSGYKLLLPYITNKPCFVYTNDRNLLFYNGYAILSDDSNALRVLEKILMSKIFWFYISNTSKPYAGNYFSVAKNYIKSFGVCNLTKEEENVLLKLENKIEIDDFLSKKYGLFLE